jgi:hypothetical protein
MSPPGGAPDILITSDSTVEAIAAVAGSHAAAVCQFSCTLKFEAVFIPLRDVHLEAKVTTAFSRHLTPQKN